MDGSNNLGSYPVSACGQSASTNWCVDYYSPYNKNIQSVGIDYNSSPPNDIATSDSVDYSLYQCMKDCQAVARLGRQPVLVNIMKKGTAPAVCQLAQMV
jgi:hypothetical protein